MLTSPNWSTVTTWVETGTSSGMTCEAWMSGSGTVTWLVIVTRASGFRHGVMRRRSTGRVPGAESLVLEGDQRLPSACGPLRPRMSAVT